MTRLLAHMIDGAVESTYSTVGEVVADDTTSTVLILVLIPSHVPLGST